MVSSIVVIYYIFLTEVSNFVISVPIHIFYPIEFMLISEYYSLFILIGDFVLNVEGTVSNLAEGSLNALPGLWDSYVSFWVVQWKSVVFV